MARPMLLIKEPLLKDLHYMRNYGVGYKHIMRKYDLPFTAPTLSKLIGYYDAMVNSEEEASGVIHASLFPEWLDKNITYQDSNLWVYRGRMPLGKWQLRDTPLR